MNRVQYVPMHEVKANVGFVLSIQIWYNRISNRFHSIVSISTVSLRWKKDNMAKGRKDKVQKSQEFTIIQNVINYKQYDMFY